MGVARLMTTIACVLKSGGWCNATDVVHLAAGVAQHCGPHRFVCLTDLPRIPGVETLPLARADAGWWSKMSLFEPGTFDGPTVYIDLDTRIVGNIDDMLAYTGKPLVLRDFFRPDSMIGSGVMLWSGNAMRSVWDAFARDPEGTMRDHNRRMDHFIVKHLPDHGFVQDTFSGVYSYKKHCRPVVPADARVVAFHGSPRPSEVTLNFARAA